MLKKIVGSLGALLVIVIIIFVIFSQQNKPQYSGDLELNNLKDSVDVYFDEIGVPHIYAQNEKDAFTTLGYLHAQDRLWQMELIRRISSGRLAEIFGKDMLETDQFFLGLGIQEAAKNTIAQLDTTAQSYQLTQAYLNGINQFIKEGKTPIEFRLAGVEKESYDILDAYNVFGYMAFSFAHAHKTDPFLTDIKENLGEAYVNALAITTSERATLIKNKLPKRKLKATNAITTFVDQLIEQSPVPAFHGSNSWVVSGKKTESGKVILANDPHISFAQPSVWYQAHVVTPNYEMYGFHLALSAFPLLGHNRHHAYGMTMFQNDDVDFYETDANQQFKERKEIIKVKGEDDVEFVVKQGKYGPVMNDLIKGMDQEKPIEMYWLYTQLQNDMLEVSYILSHAKSLTEFRHAADLIHAPGLNVMYGDAKNNIGWFASAQLLDYNNDYDSKFIFKNGETPYMKQIEFDRNPQAVNPRWGYVYSANNQPEKIDDKFYPGYYLPEDRAKRIVEILDDKKGITAKDMQHMINDVSSAVVPELIPIIVDKISKLNLSETEKEALKALKNWDGVYLKEANGPVIYNKFLYRFLYNTFADEMGEDNFKHFLSLNLYKRQIAKQIKSYKSVWWDDINTKEIKENRDEIFTKSFHESVTELTTQLGSDVDNWQWQDVAQAIHKHAFDKIGAIRGYFNVGPFKTNGGNEVINNQLFKLNGSGVYEITAGPSTRRVVDFSDIENSVAVLPTGQSGNVFSKHYKNQAEQYVEGTFFKMKLNKEEIMQSEDRMFIIPISE